MSTKPKVNYAVSLGEPCGTCGKRGERTVQIIVMDDDESECGPFSCKECLGRLKEEMIIDDESKIIIYDVDKIFEDAMELVK